LDKLRRAARYGREPVGRRTALMFPKFS
jgi:hypothetical protein